MKMNSDRLYEQPTNEELAEYREIFDLVDRGEKIDLEPRLMNNEDVTKKLQFSELHRNKLTQSSTKSIEAYNNVFMYRYSFIV